MVEPSTLGEFAASALSLAAPEVLKAAVAAVVKDAYDALKAFVGRWGAKEVQALEDNPGSAGRRLTVAEIIDRQSEADRAEIDALARRLIAALRAAGPVGLDIDVLEGVAARLGPITVTEGTGARIGRVTVAGEFETGAITVGRGASRKN